MSNRPRDDNSELATEAIESITEIESIPEFDRESNRESHDVLDCSNCPEPHIHAKSKP